MPPSRTLPSPAARSPVANRCRPRRTPPAAPGRPLPGRPAGRVDDRGGEDVRTRLVTAGVGAAWEAALVRACQAGQVAAQVLHRCYDLGDLLAVAAAGQAEVAVVAAGTRWLDRDALARLAAAGLAVVGVASAGDEDSERRLRQLGLLHIASEADPPDALVDRARAALAAEPDPGVDRAALAAEPDPGEEPPEPDQVPAPPDRDTRRILAAVWGPKGGPGRTTVAVNLAFEAAAVGGEVLLVDADTYGGAVAQAIARRSHRLHCAYGGYLALSMRSSAYYTSCRMATRSLSATTDTSGYSGAITIGQEDRM